MGGKSENEIREVLVVLHVASMQSLLRAIKICNYICMDYTNPQICNPWDLAMLG